MSTPERLSLGLANASRRRDAAGHFMSARESEILTRYKLVLDRCDAFEANELLYLRRIMELETSAVITQHRINELATEAREYRAGADCFETQLIAAKAEADHRANENQQLSETLAAIRRKGMTAVLVAALAIALMIAALGWSYVRMSP